MYMGRTGNYGALYLIPIEYAGGDILHWNCKHHTIDCGEIEPIHLISWDLDYLDAPWRVEIMFDHNWYLVGVNRSVSKEELVQFREKCFADKQWADISIFNGLENDEILEELECKTNELRPMVQVLNEVIERIDFSKFCVCFMYYRYYWH